MHVELADKLTQSGVELKISMFIGSVTFMFPISLINKYVYTRMTARKFHLSSANIIDLGIFALVTLWYESFAIYSS